MTFGEDWGWGADPATSARLLDAYLDAGGNSIDTANIYTNGHSEQIIGNYLAGHPGRRDRLVLGTKFSGNLHIGDPNSGGASRKSILGSLEESLRRLQTDYVDLLWLHNWDRRTPIEETLRTLDDLVRDGKVRYVGFSDVPAWVASEAQTIARLRGWTPLTAVQLEYSLLARTVEGAHLPMCQAHGIGVMPWSPLKNGRLTGKYRRGQEHPIDAKRTGFAADIPEAEWPIIDEFCTIADELEISPAAAAIAWVQSRPAVDSTLIGARTLEHCRATSLRSRSDSTPLSNSVSIRSRPRTSNFPPMYLDSSAALQAAGSTIDGQGYATNPPLLNSSARY